MRKTCLVICLTFMVILPVINGCGGSNGSSVTTPQQEDGSSYETAIKVGSIGEQLDIMNGTSCGEGGFFRKTHVEVVEINANHYDKVDAACTSGSTKRQFYFDVSSCFPCPD
jgi:hypothetical protein